MGFELGDEKSQKQPLNRVTLVSAAFFIGHAILNRAKVSYSYTVFFKFELHNISLSRLCANIGARCRPRRYPENVEMWIHQAGRDEAAAGGCPLSFFVFFNGDVTSVDIGPDTKKEASAAVA